MPLGMKVGLGPGDFVLDGDPVSLPKKGAEPPIFGPCLLGPNGWMHQDASAQATLMATVATIDMGAAVPLSRGSWVPV